MKTTQTATGGGMVRVEPDGIADDLKAYPSWVLHRNKEPFDAKTGERASVTDSRTWASFDAALEAYEEECGKWDGIGFVFSSGDPFVGIDLDDCLDAAGVLAEWAEKIVAAFPKAYKEASPSGRGVHVIARGKAPSRKRGNLEVYCVARYFRITGVAL